MSRIKAPTLRLISILVVGTLVVIGLASKAGIGTLSAFGYKTISAICPLGALEAMLASRTLIPRVLISLAVLAIIGILVGRIFCAWVCPVPLLRKWFGRKSKEESAKQIADEASFEGSAIGAETIADTTPVAGAVAEIALPVDSDPHPTGQASKVQLDSRHWVLGGALLSTAVFGFPVFCLVCPIGLTFATVIGVWRLFQFNEPTWMLLVFPAVLALELVVFRKWCRRICPLGALVSLVSSLNVSLRPTVDKKKCLRTAQGVDCRACKDACYEEIDLHHAKTSQPLSECTKCRDCAESCPVSAITFPWSARSGKAFPVRETKNEAGSIEGTAPEA